MKNYAGRGGCYPPRPKAEVDKTLRDLQNSPYPTQAEFNNCFIYYSFKIFSSLKLENLLAPISLLTQPRPLVFSVNGSITCSGLYF